MILISLLFPGSAETWSFASRLSDYQAGDVESPDMFGCPKQQSTSRVQTCLAVPSSKAHRVDLLWGPGVLCRVRYAPDLPGHPVTPKALHNQSFRGRRSKKIGFQQRMNP